MKAAPVSLNGTGVLALAGVVALGVVALVIYNKGPKALAAVNPFNHDNAAAGAVNEYGASINTAPDDPGKNADGSWSLGGWVYDVLNPGTYDAIKNIGQPVNTGGVTGSW